LGLGVVSFFVIISPKVVSSYVIEYNPYSFPNALIAGHCSDQGANPYYAADP